MRTGNGRDERRCVKQKCAGRDRLMISGQRPETRYYLRHNYLEHWSRIGGEAEGDCGDRDTSMMGHDELLESANRHLDTRGRNVTESMRREARNASPGLTWLDLTSAECEEASEECRECEVRSVGSRSAENRALRPPRCVFYPGLSHTIPACSNNCSRKLLEVDREKEKARL